MFNPDLKDVLKDHLSRYSLVTATAKRARAISDDAIENEEIIVEKPVRLSRANTKLLNPKKSAISNQTCTVR